MSETNVISGPWEARVVPLPAKPRKHFGLKKRIDQVIETAISAAPICHTLQAELAAEIGVVAKLAEFCADKAASYPSPPNVRAAATLRDVQSILETMSAELAP